MDPVQQPTSCGAHYFPYVMRAWNREYSPCLPAPLRALARTVEIIFFSVVDFFLIPLRCCQSRNPPEIVDPNEGSASDLVGPPAPVPVPDEKPRLAPPPAAQNLNLEQIQNLPAAALPPAKPAQEADHSLEASVAALANQEQPGLNQALGLNPGPALKQMPLKEPIPKSIPDPDLEISEEKGFWPIFDSFSLNPAESVAESSAPASLLTRPEGNKIWEGASQRAGSTSEGKEEEGSPSSPSAQSSDKGEISSAGSWNDTLDIQILSSVNSPSAAALEQKERDFYWDLGENVDAARG